jgi:hypothetical protein
VKFLACLLSALDVGGAWQQVQGCVEDGLIPLILGDSPIESNVKPLRELQADLFTLFFLHLDNNRFTTLANADTFARESHFACTQSALPAISIESVQHSPATPQSPGAIRADRNQIRCLDGCAGYACNW